MAAPEQPADATHTDRGPPLLDTTVAFRASTPAGHAAPDPDGYPRIPGYEVLGPIGRGGMGLVFRARHVALNRIVALKMVALPRPELAERFHLEAEALAALAHPNIVQIYEVGEHDGQPFLSLQYVAGGTLAQHIDGAPQPPREAARLVERLARAMAAAHERGVIHRDLKPANILLADDGTPRITDFGLAKQLDADDAHTQAGDLLGTLNYMAPEQAEGRVRDIGPPTDIHALGTILYEMLVGRVPFRGANPLETLALVRAQAPVPPRQLQPLVPAALEAICLKCLAKEPAQRYSSALALAADLDAFLAGRPIRLPSAPARTWQWLRRRPVVVGLAGALLLTLGGLLIAAALAAWLGVQAAEHSQAAQETRRLLDEQKQRADRAAAGEKDAREREQTAADAEQLARQQLVSAAARNQLVTLPGRLTAGDPLDAGQKHRRTHTLRLQQGQVYLIDLQSADFDAYLEIHDQTGKLLLSDDDGGGALNARLVFPAPQTAVYRLIVTTFQPRQTGAFVLTVSPPPIDRRIQPEHDGKGRPDAAPQSFVLHGPPAFWAHWLGLLASPVSREWQAATPLAQAAHFRLQERTRLAKEARQRLSQAIKLVDQPRTGEAETAYRRVIAIFDALAADEPLEAAHRQALAQACTNLALLLLRGRPDDAEVEPLLWRALPLWEEAALRRPPTALVYNEAGVVQSHLASRLFRRDNLPAALVFYRRAVEHYQDALTRAPANGQFRNNFVLAYTSVFQTLLRSGQLEAAHLALRNVPDALPANGPERVHLYCRCRNEAVANSHPEFVPFAEARAVQALDAALASGYKDYFGLAFEPAVAPLKRRADFLRVYRDRVGLDWDRTRTFPGRLTAKDPPDKQHPRSHCRVRVEKFEAGKTYRVDLASNDFDVILRIEDTAGKPLHEDDDSAGNLNARLLFTPQVSADYRVVVTSYSPGALGNYVLGIQEVSTPR